MATAVRGRNRRYQTYGRVGYGAYDGSAARVLEREEVLQPRPQVRPRKRAIVRPKVQVREAGQVSIFAVVGFIAVGVFAVLLLMAYVELTVISEDVVGMKSQMEVLKTEEARLRAQYELAYDLNSIESAMTSSGAMVKPQSSQIFYVDLSAPDSVTFFEQEDPVEGLRGAWESLRSVWGNVVEYFQ